MTERGGEERIEARWQTAAGLDLTLDNDLELSVLVSHQLDDVTESCSPRVVPVPAASTSPLRNENSPFLPQTYWG